MDLVLVALDLLTSGPIKPDELPALKPQLLLQVNRVSVVIEKYPVNGVQPDNAAAGVCRQVSSPLPVPLLCKSGMLAVSAGC